MNAPTLSTAELQLLTGIFRRHPEIKSVKLFGSRAKGMHRPESDIDLAIWGDLHELQTESIALELDELPLPYQFDLKLYSSITERALQEHIDRVGIVIYQA